MMRIPEKGLSREDVFSTLDAFRANDIDWRSGRVWAYVYDAGKEAEDVVKTAYAGYLSENALDPTVFPSMHAMEMQIIRMMANHLGGDETTTGSFTSGGTESIILAVKAARDYARKVRGIAEPEIILPYTAHASFQKAADYLDVGKVLVPVDPETYKADVDAMCAAITENTIMLVGSACSYAHGVVDPIPELGQLALEKNLLLHVDGCIGGFVLPYFERLGAKVTPFDLSVPGVTSISCDLHKYAYAAKGASVLLHNNADVRRQQIYACADWSGYTVVNNTVQSTKSGGPLAGAWAALNFIGDDGYMDIMRTMLDATRQLVEGIEAIPGLRLMAQPESNLIAFTSDEINIFHIADEMKERGWFIQPQLRSEGSKENIHLSVNPKPAQYIEELLSDLAECTEIARGLPTNNELAAMVTDALATMGDGGLPPEAFGNLMGMVGVDGVALPERMAEINGLMNVLPPQMRELLLCEFVNQLYS